MKTLIFLCLCFGLSHAMRLKKTALPIELRRIMANVTSLDSFLRAVSAERMKTLWEGVTALNEREKGPGNHCPVVNQLIEDCPPKGKDLCTDDSSCPSGLTCCSTGCIKECVRGIFGLARFAQNSDFPDLPHVILDSAPCALRPVVVEVPQPVDENAFYFPFFVTLYRCGGACNARPFETTCQPHATKDLNLVVSKMAWSSSTDKLKDMSNEFTAVRVTNHTSCSCQCTVKPTDCDNETQRYSKEHCSCQCIKPRGSCPFNFQWDPVKCQCVCNPTHKFACRKRLEFNEKLCACTCSTKPCKLAVKVRDPHSCRCRCPRLKCPIGMIYDQRSCTCRGTISRVSDE